MPSDSRQGTDSLTLAQIYLRDHAIPEQFAADAGWSAEYHYNRPAIKFKTKNGDRWRYLDDKKPKYNHADGYEMCWYGLDAAINKPLAKDKRFILETNGAASVLCAQAHKLPAYALMSGEMTVPPTELIAELKSKWNGTILIALDCDGDGRNGAIKRIKAYREAGIVCEAIDLALDLQGADLADFCRMHPTDTYSKLVALDWLVIPEDEPKPIYDTPYKKPEGSKEEDPFEMATLAVNALSQWRRDKGNYRSWINIAMALSDPVMGDMGFGIWDRWSAAGEGYKQNICVSQWKSVLKRRAKQARPYNLPSLYKWADEDYGTGWRPIPEYEPSSQPELKAPAPVLSSEQGDTLQFDNGLPIGIRAALSAYCAPAVAPVVEVWNEAIVKGLIEQDEPVDATYLQCVSEALGRNLSIATIRSGLKQGAVVFLRNSAHYVFYKSNTLEGNQEQTLSPEFMINSVGCEKPRPGRKSVLYTLPTRSELVTALARRAIAPILQKHFPLEDGVLAPIHEQFLAQLGYDDTEAEAMQRDLEARYKALFEAQPHYTEYLTKARRAYGRLLAALSSDESAPLAPGVPYENSREYLGRCANAIIEAHGGETQIAREKWTELLGCKKANLGAIFKRGEVRVIKDQTCDVPLSGLDELKRINPKWHKPGNGRPMQVRSTTNKKPFVFDKDNASMYRWAEEELALGGVLSLRCHQANKQTTAPLPAPEFATVEHAPKVIAPPQLELFPEPKKKFEPIQGCALPPKARAPKIPYARNWFDSVVALATPINPVHPLVYGEGRAVDMDTGDIVDYDVQLGLLALLKDNSS